MADTIAALATPAGVSGLSVIRVSGSESIGVIDKIFSGKKRVSEIKSHSILYGNITENSRTIDTVTVSLFKSPNSYTGEDVIEIGCHGSMVVVRQILDILYKNGIRPAEAGEFTKRAFVNGKLDLLQVEAVADIIHSISTPSAQTSMRQLEGNFTQKLKEFRQSLIHIASLLELELDFSDEGVELISKDLIKEKLNHAKDFCNTLIQQKTASQILRSGFYVSIIGYPNSGKSTLFNALLNRNRALVSDIEGTTRDYLEEYLYLSDIAIKLFDTAGLRETEDTIEIMGIKLVESVIKQSNLLLLLNDITKGENNSDSLLYDLQEKFPNVEIILVQNKVDAILSAKTNQNSLYISAKNASGIEKVKQIIAEKAGSNIDVLSDVLVNQRHYDLLKITIENLDRAATSLELFSENELIAIDIRNAYRTIGEITGENYSEEVINNIFGAFCIGK